MFPRLPSGCGFQLLTWKIKRRALFWSHCAIESSTCVTAIIHVNHCTRDLMSVAWFIDQWRTTKSELVAADSRWCCVTSQNYFVEIDWIGYVWRQSWCCRFIWESWWSFCINFMTINQYNNKPRSITKRGIRVLIVAINKKMISLDYWMLDCWGFYSNSDHVVIMPGTSNSGQNVWKTQ